MGNARCVVFVGNNKGENGHVRQQLADGNDERGIRRGIAGRM